MSKHTFRLGMYTITAEEGWRARDGNIKPYMHIGWKRDDEVVDILPMLSELRDAVKLYFIHDSQYADLTFEEFIKAMFDDQSFR